MLIAALLVFLASIVVALLGGHSVGGVVVALQLAALALVLWSRRARRRRLASEAATAMHLPVGNGTWPPPMPKELLQPPPRPVPRWARARENLVVHTAAALALAFAGMFILLSGEVLPALPAFAFAGVFAAFHVERRRVLRLLTDGSAATGLVVRTHHGGGNLHIYYRFPVPEGQRENRFGIDQGRVILDLGCWPEVGDAVFVAYDPAPKGKSTLWSVAPAPGTRRPGRLVQPLRGRAGATYVLGAALILGLSGTVVWYLAR